MSRPRILLLGGNGQVGRALQRTLLPLGDVVAPGRAELDLLHPLAVVPYLEQVAPAWVVNAAAYTAVDRAESEPDAAKAINTELPKVLAANVPRLGYRVVHYSTDYVFDGKASAPYVETDAPNPQSVYGRTKLAGDEAILTLPDALVLRLSWVFGPDGGNFVRTMVRLARERDQLSVVADEHGCPTPAELVADVSLLAMHQKVEGLFHLSSASPTTWYAFAQAILAEAWTQGVPGLRVRPGLMEPIVTSEYPTRAVRPANSVLDTSKLARTLQITLPTWMPYLQALIARIKSGN